MYETENSVVEVVNSFGPELKASVVFQGNIDVFLTNELLATFGTINETWNATVYAVVDGQWEDVEGEEGFIETFIPTEEKNEKIVGTAIYTATKTYIERYCK